MVNNVDNEAPQFSYVPEDLTLPCEAPLPSSFPEATDACSPVIYAASDTLVEHPTVGVYQVIRTFEVSDVYGNVADSLQTFTVLDDLPPVFTFVPPGDTVVCDAPPVLVQAEAVDNCGDVTMVVSEEIAEEDALGNQTLVRRFEAFDFAGNSTRGHPSCCNSKLRGSGIWSCARRRHLDVRPTVAGRLARSHPRMRALGTVCDRGHAGRDMWHPAPWCAHSA